MQDIVVREYVRTVNGEIFKIVGMKRNEGLTLYLTDQYGQYSENVLMQDMKNHSKNIFDLIETGDILKIKEGNLVCYVSWDNDTDVSLEEIRKRANNKDFLLAIITREQAKTIEYEVNK